MDRRAFIVGTAGGVLAAGPMLATGADGTGKPARIATYVTNLRDNGGRTGVPRPGTTVTLMRVRDRAFDPLSIAVLDAGGRQLGFLPAAHGQVLAPLMDAGIGFGATVEDAVNGPNPRLDLSLELAGAGSKT